MSTSESNKPTTIPFKSKKLLKNAISKPPNPNPSMLATKTPEKPPAKLVGGARKSALSLNQIRRAAQSKPKSQDSAAQIKSARKQILSWPQSRKTRDAVPDPNKLPESYEMLARFFDGLDNSIRLLRMKGSMTTFANISPKIECLTDRRFSHSHLAQLVYVLPEAFDIRKVLTLDERTCCTKPDLHVSLNADAIKCEEKAPGSKNIINLRKVFRERLTDLYRSLPEGEEIPEAVLPEPFNHSKQTQQSDSKHHNESTDTLQQQQLSSANQAKNPVVASHLPQSFTRRFSKRLLDIDGSETCEKLAKLRKLNSCDETPSSLPPVEHTKSMDVDDSSLVKAYGIEATPAKLASTPAKLVKLASTPAKQSFTPAKLALTPAKYASTPAKLASTPLRLMTATPKLQPQRRLYMTPDDDDKLTRRPSRTGSSQKSLRFDAPTLNEEPNKDHLDVEDSDKINQSGSESSDDEDLHILPPSLRRSIKENERRFMEEQDPVILEAQKRHKTIQHLPKLFNVMHFLFQSIQRTIFPKEDLLSRILTGHFDIVDRKELEEQLNLLLEIVPDWISEKMGSSGDMLICVNKMSTPQSIRARLEEAR